MKRFPLLCQNEEETLKRCPPCCGRCWETLDSKFSVSSQPAVIACLQWSSICCQTLYFLAGLAFSASIEGLITFDYTACLSLRAVAMRGSSNAVTANKRSASLEPRVRNTDISSTDFERSNPDPSRTLPKRPHLLPASYCYATSPCLATLPSSAPQMATTSYTGVLSQRQAGSTISWQHHTASNNCMPAVLPRPWQVPDNSF